MPPVRLAALLATVAFLAPLASAAPAQGTIDVVGAIEFPAGARASAPGGEWLWDADAAPDLRIDARSVRIERWGNTTDRAVLGGVEVTTTEIRERGSHGASTLHLDAGAGAQIVAARAASVSAEFGNATARALAGASIFQRTPVLNMNCDESDCLEAQRTYEVSGVASNLTLEGDLIVFLYGPTLVVREGGAETTYASGVVTTRQGVVDHREDAWIVARVTGARAVALGEPAQTRVFLAQPLLEAPTARAESATGAVEVGARTYRVSKGAFEAGGALLLAPTPIETGGMEASRRFTYAPGFTTRLQGDVSDINLDAVPVYEDQPAETAGALLGLAAVAAALAYYWPAVQFHATAALLPLYTRLKKPDILENDVRNAIYEIVRQNPGISARAVHRMSDQSWGTVVYHLRQLERHHVLVSRALGRTRNYYENHGKYRGMEVQLACLQSERARVLARLVAVEPGISQEILVTRSGYPQPTTSYYVRKLKRAGLLDEVREGRYVRYQPRDELARFLEIAEQALADAPAGPPAGPANA